MGLFKSKEEKALKKEASVAFMGSSLQPIGKIPSGSLVFLTLKPAEKVLNIHFEKTDITLPYDRIRGFQLESETTLAKNGSTIGRAMVGGALFGNTGAVVGSMSAKGNIKSKWIGILSYIDKEDNPQELRFIQWGVTGPYEDINKHYGMSKFETQVNEIVARYAENITEL